MIFEIITGLIIGLVLGILFGAWCVVWYMNTYKGWGDIRNIPFHTEEKE